MARSKVYNIPNLLCMFRLAVIPVILTLFYFDGPTAAWINTVLFFIAGITDFLDGYIARATGQTTVLGKFLDASTDKMLVGVVLVALIAFDRLDGLWIIPAILIYLREILISGVREFMALYNVVVPISMLGKWKLTLQIIALGTLIGAPYGGMAYAVLGKLLFLVATAMTVVSGWDYVREAWKTIQKLDNEKAM